MARAALPRLNFFGGKGGVGKTTCAAAAAVRAAAEGARVLVVSTDPAHSLGDVLGLELRAEAQRVRGASGELYAAELDADSALTRWLGEREEAIRTIADRGTYFDEEDIDRLLSLSFPGVDELVGLVELLRLARMRPLDVVVVDTAPTGHTLRLLQMPETLKRLGEVLDAMHAKHRFLAASLGGAWRPDFADDAIAGIEREALSLREILGDRSRASFTWVTLPEELPVLESEDGVRELDRLGVGVDVVVVNRTWPAPDRHCSICTSRFEEQHALRARIGEMFAGKTVLEVPAWIESPAGAAQLLEVARSVTVLDVRSRSAPVAESIATEQVASSARAASLIRPSARLAFVGGKGGVGKTTVAAAAALELAETRPRDRILLLSTDPAHSLGDVLAAPVSDEARPIHGAPPNLDVRELDASQAWESERERYRNAIDELFASMFRGEMSAAFDRQVLEDLVDLAPPGIDELFAIVTLLDALREPGGSVGSAPRGKAKGGRTRGGRYDLVVVDTAPTGHTLRLLALPQKALDWVHALMSIILKYRRVIGLGELAGDLTNLARRLRSLIALLSDPAQVAFVVVTRPEALARLETERLATDLDGRGIPISAIIANAVTLPACARCSAIAEVERTELAQLARLAARSPRSMRIIMAPSVHPPPRGRELRRWRDAWSERGLRSS